MGYALNYKWVKRRNVVVGKNSEFEISNSIGIPD